ncbi:MAG: sigma-70 family RNA polymerase sigma factor [Planctomycetota bacterium]|nr:sigma-70 family RNA polymerase sigma factor [Planctomycetota bacterium]
MPPGYDGSGDWSDADWKGFDDLVRRAQADDPEAKNRICAKIGPHVLRCAMAYSSFVRAVDSAEDLAQDSLIRICDKIGTFRGGCDDEQTFKMFWGWSRRLTWNVCFNAKRDSKRKKRNPGHLQSLDALELHSKHTTPYSAACWAELCRRIQAEMVALLTDGEAEIVELIFFKGLILVEVADTLGLEDEEVSSILAAALRKLRPPLEDLL